MERTFKEYFWVFQLGLVILVALLGALAVNNVLTAQLSPFLVTEPPKVSDKDTKTDTTTPRLASIPDSLWVPPAPPEDPDAKTEEPPQEVEAIPEENDPTEDYPHTSLNLNLTGTLVADDPTWSLATIEDSSRSTAIVSEKEAIEENVTIHRIESRSVILNNNGNLERLDLENDGSNRGAPSTQPRRPAYAPPAKAKPTPAKPAPAPKKNDRFSKLREGIQKKNENEFAIQRSVITEVLTNPRKYRDGTKPIPHYVNGKPAGFKLTRMKPGSIYYDLGLQSNDVITSVNGKPLTSPNVLLDFYSKFQSGKLDGVSLGIERNGQKVQTQYNVGK